MAEVIAAFYQGSAFKLGGELCEESDTPYSNFQGAFVLLFICH